MPEGNGKQRTKTEIFPTFSITLEKKIICCEHTGTTNNRVCNPSHHSLAHDCGLGWDKPGASVQMINADVQTDFVETPTDSAPSGSQTPESKTDNVTALYCAFCVVVEPVRMSDDEILKTFVIKDSSDLNSEERLVLSSVYELMDALDMQRKAMIAKLRSSKVFSQVSILCCNPCSLRFKD